MVMLLVWCLVVLSSALVGVAGRLRSTYTSAGRALKSYRTSYSAGMARWDHRYHSWGRKLEYAAISVEAGRYARSET